MLPTSLWAIVPPKLGSIALETALLFCAIRLTETLGTLSFTRDTRAGYEMSLCMRLEPYSLSLTAFCLSSPALALDVTLNPVRYGSVASCMFPKASPKARNKIQARLDPGD
jgi:hypothetical protein